MAYYGGNQRKQKNPLKYALRLLRYRVRFENELRRRLKNQGFSEEEIEDTIATLKRQGYIDDEKSAFLFAIDEMRLKLFGPKILKMKLRSLGVDEETSERAIEKALSEIDFSEELKRLKTRFKDRREIKDYLYKRGFEISHIEEILDQIDGGEQ
ncbi:RecX family transcriptional regulator [Thermotoga sp.]|uniref:regulatory protein RecX n=1 Tax=Thermotoga sp. TaxID=28240 RepID=UPI0025DC15A1|nr:RecX family transcriptional regulator [Thermotoga sp.]MCD6551419.1 RecX family transcriptional regulator [Thermotoga sp.]